jgi:signal transduction histidine kinase
MRWRTVLKGVGCLAVLLGFWFLSQDTAFRPLYHTGVELFAVVIAAAIFTIGWNSRGFARDDMLLVLAVGYLSVGFLDLLHALAYGEVNVFPDSGADLAIQLWMAARAVEAVTLLLGAITLGSGRKVNAGALLVAYGLVTAALVLVTIVFPVFPACYIQTEGLTGRLTSFKIWGEAAVSLVLLGAGSLLWLNRRRLDRRILLLALGSVAATVLSELCFMFYTSLYAAPNVAGHILKLISFALIYQALVRGSLLTPYASLFRDLERELSFRRRAEARLTETMDKLERSNAELEQFAYVASHDLQEPLRKVRAFGDRLREVCAGALPERGLDYLARMQSAAERMSRLISDLLELSRVTTRGRPFERVDLRAAAQNAVTDLESAVERTGGRVDIGEMAAVEADPTQMRQLLQNLIANALKFHREDAAPVVQVDARIVEGHEAGPQCLVTVADNGIGFDEEDLERIFGVFQRLHTREEYDGTGIGLATCRQIAHRHNGEITARSRPGEGSEFVVTLPVTQPGEPEGG